MTVIVTTAEELRALIREELARATPANAPDEWMSADDVAKWLGVKRSTIPALVTREALPCYRPGKSYTFRRSEVAAWLLARPNRRSKPDADGGTLSVLPGGKR